MSVNADAKFVCSGWARNSGGVDGFLSQQVLGCKCAYVAATGTWQVTYDTPNVDPAFDRCDWSLSPDLSSLINSGGMLSPVLAAPSNINNVGFVISFFDRTGAAVSNPAAGCFFRVTYRPSR